MGTAVPRFSVSLVILLKCVSMRKKYHANSDITYISEADNET